MRDTMAVPSPLIAGNWKMNGLAADGVARAEALAALARAEPPSAEVVICPPATLLCRVGAAIGLSPLLLGAQDCHAAEAGAHTGDVSAPMLVDAGCRYVILGHSERRSEYGETDREAAEKVKAAHHAGLGVILCVGESAEERAAGRALDVVAGQLLASMPAGAGAEDTVIAYEPVWAIGSGRTPEPAEIAAVHARLKAALAPANPRILYGGSVSPANAAEILALEGVDGALVGGASLVAADFWAIVRSCP